MLPCDCPPAQVCYQCPDLGDCPDGAVNVPDLLTLLAAWGPCGDVRCLGPTGWCCEWGDLDRDGEIGVSDLVLLLAWWGPIDYCSWVDFRCQ